MLKGPLATAVLGTIAAGSLLVWQGGGTVDGATQLVKDQANKILQFKQNETALVNKLTTVNAQLAAAEADKANLEAQIAQLTQDGTASKQTISDLQAQLDAAKAEIATLTAERDALMANDTTSQADGETLATEVQRLDAQLTQANTDAAELQTAIDSIDTTVAPDQTAVDAAVGGNTTTTTPPPTTTQTAPDGYVSKSLITDVPMYLSNDITLNTQADGSVVIKNINEVTEYTATINGTSTAIPGDGLWHKIGTVDSLAYKTLDITASGKTTIKIFLTK